MKLLITIFAVLVLLPAQSFPPPVPVDSKDHFFYTDSPGGDSDIVFGQTLSTALNFHCDIYLAAFGSQAELNPDERIELFHLRARLAEAERDKLFTQIACENSKDASCGKSLDSYVADAKKAREEAISRIAKEHFLGPRAEVDEDIKVMWPEAQYGSCQEDK